MVTDLGLFDALVTDVVLAWHHVGHSIIHGVIRLLAVTAKKKFVAVPLIRHSLVNL